MKGSRLGGTGMAGSGLIVSQISHAWNEARSIGQSTAVEHTTLGRTGLRVSVAGLGCGGHSRLGDSPEAIVHRALELGVTFIDTAEAYGTEEAVGRGTAGHRDEVVLCTKHSGRGPLAPSLDGSLSRLGTDRVDVYLLHGVAPDEYGWARDVWLPEARAAREQGKVRWIGLSERFIRDPEHAMLPMALDDGCWDVLMVGFNILNQSARPLLERAHADGIGTLCMFAARRALSRPRPDDPVPDALDLPADAYRFCRAEPSLDVILTGTGSAEHLEANIRAITGPRMTDDALARLRAIDPGVALSGE